MLIVNLALAAALFVAIMTGIFATARLLAIIQPIRGPPRAHRRGKATHLMIVLGSGGHTAEMLAMLKTMDTVSYSHRSYIVSAGDPLSVERARHFEAKLEESCQKALSQQKYDGKSLREGVQKAYGSYSISVVPRARKIHQSLLTTPFSCLNTFRSTLGLLRNPPSKGKAVPKAPDLILTNGPATSAIVIFSSLILRFLDVFGEDHGRTRIVFVESMARIHSLSLSAKCVAFVVDRLIVQWESLKGAAFGRAEYGGPIVISGLVHD